MTIPQHVAFIMDGNRRWAKQRNLPVIAGHEAGKNQIEPLIDYAEKKGIATVTFWAFSSENWKRGSIEVGFILLVFRAFLKSGIAGRLLKRGGKVNVLGDLEVFPQDIVKEVKAIINKSKNNTGIVINFALNYGGRNEIIHAVNNLLKKGVTQVDETLFSANLFTDRQRDPDLIIRTGGEQRLSGFLPWQSIYSELHFPDIYWPDFTEQEFEKSLKEYSTRERRFGK